MAGRGRPHKAQNPDAKCANGKFRPGEVKHLPRCPGKDLTEEKQGDKTKEKKPKAQKKTSHNKEKPSVQRAQKVEATENFTEIKKQQSAPADNIEAPVQQTKDKTKEEKTKPQQETPKDKKAKKILEKAEEKVLEVQQETPKDKKAKQCLEKAEEKVLEVQQEIAKGKKAKKCLEKAEEKVLEVQHEIPKDKKACVLQDRCGDKVDSILRTTLKKLRIKKDERADAAKVINEIVKQIITHLRQNSVCFKDVGDPLRTGSYYENLKIFSPDEFDVMLPIPVQRVKINPFGEDGAFYSVELKRGNNPLQKFEENSALSASKMLQEFRDEVKKCVKLSKEWVVTKKKEGCPAVTLATTGHPVPISLDVVLSLMVKSSWPPFTKDGMNIGGWLGAKVKQDFKWKGYYLVPKYKGRGNVERDGVLSKDVWRVSFSHVEKAIMKNHGSQKTCCEKGGEPCCRKDCLRLLKHLLSLLKEKDSSLAKFCSYHAKTTLLHACCSRTKDSEWPASSLSHCFRLLLNDFVTHLESRELTNFFIPSQNLLSGIGVKKCKDLALCIREECEKGFPIFK